MRVEHASRKRALAATAVVTAVLACVGCVSIVDLVEEPAPSPSSSPTTAPEPTVVDTVVATDTGATEHAQGEASLTGDGVFDYVVAAGDTTSAIGFRFGICTLDVILSNLPQDPWPLTGQTIAVRRVTDIPIGSDDCRFDVDQDGWR